MTVNDSLRAMTLGNPDAMRTCNRRSEKDHNGTSVKRPQKAAHSFLLDVIS